MAYPDDPCEGCPRAARGKPMPCPGQSVGGGILCMRAKEGIELYKYKVIYGLSASRPSSRPPESRPDPRILIAVAECPHRGGVLPVSFQPECGCRELTECRLGKGAPRPGVTLAECIACISALVEKQGNPKISAVP
jgi:hypothetical protein